MFYLWTSVVFSRLRWAVGCTDAKSDKIILVSIMLL